jgi:hypothetical protein
MGDGAEVPLKLAGNGFQRSVASLSSAAMQGSEWSLKFVVEVGEG